MAKPPRELDPRLQELGIGALFEERFAQVVAAHGGPTEVARKFGMDRNTVGNWVSGKTRPPLFDVALLCAEVGRSIDWLLGLTAEPGGAGDFALIPRLELRPSAGGGTIAVHENEFAEFVAFRADWLRKLGISGKNARTMFVHGDSMEPTIRDGDLLLVDHSIDRIVDNGIYIVVFQGRVLVKRVQIRRDGTVVLTSDNTHYSPEEVAPQEVPEIHVAGRVRWYGRTI